MNTQVTLAPTLLQILVATVLPMLVALVTSRIAAPSVKALTLIVLSAIGGWLTELQASGGTFVLRNAIVTTVTTLVVAIASHFGIWKPLRITGSGGVIQGVVPIGIGRESAAARTAVPREPAA